VAGYGDAADLGVKLVAMDPERLPLEFGNLPLGSLYEERLVEDLLLLVEVVSACREENDQRLAELGVCAAPMPAGIA